MMAKIKKLTAFILILLMLISVSGCKNGSSKESSSSLKIVCTFFPLYDWVKNITAEMEPDRAEDLFGQDHKERTTNVEIILLYDNGTDLHSYQATARDMVEIATCDLIVYVGGESDKWIEDALKNSTNPNQKVICLMDVMGDALLHQDHGHAEGEECDLEHDTHTYDEHVWLSLRNAELFCEIIGDAMEEIDGENKALYSINTGIYLEKLRELDKYLSDVVKDATFDTLIFADRFPFGYLMEDYGITCYAAFDGCSSETEASFETVIALASKLNELETKTVLTTESPAGKVAETVINAAKANDVNILSLNSMQSVSKEDIENGQTYLSLMEENAAALKAALH